MLANELIKKQGCVHDNVKPVRVMLRLRDRGSDINFMAFWCVVALYDELMEQWTNQYTDQPTNRVTYRVVCM